MFTCPINEFFLGSKTRQATINSCINWIRAVDTSGNKLTHVSIGVHSFAKASAVLFCEKYYSFSEINYNYNCFLNLKIYFICFLISVLLTNPIKLFLFRFHCLLVNIYQLQIHYMMQLNKVCVLYCEFFLVIFDCDVRGFVCRK
jgi:hypothetical protein